MSGFIPDSYRKSIFVADIIDDRDFSSMLFRLKTVYGYDFSNYADSSIKRRCLHFMDRHHIGTIAALEGCLIADESAFEEFIQTLSVTVTQMFRDPLFYKILRVDIVKRLLTYPFIKVWVAGCATGEEAVSLAILFHEEGILDRTRIYATDINQRSIEQARLGIFPLDQMKNYTVNYQRSGGKSSFSDYYVAKYGSALFHADLRKHIVFSNHNLATDGSFNEFQLILCRNVLIYFNKQLQNRVISIFYDSLCMYGYLGLGNKESVQFTDLNSCFEIIDKKEKIYMKTR